jgi:hypothetical protein
MLWDMLRCNCEQNRVLFVFILVSVCKKQHPDKSLVAVNKCFDVRSVGLWTGNCCCNASSGEPELTSEITEGKGCGRDELAA